MNRDSFSESLLRRDARDEEIEAPDRSELHAGLMLSAGAGFFGTGLGMPMLADALSQMSPAAGACVIFWVGAATIVSLVVTGFGPYPAE